MTVLFSISFLTASKRHLYTMVWLCVLRYSGFKKNVQKQRGFTYNLTWELHAVHSLHVFPLLLGKDLKRPPPWANTNSSHLGGRLREIRLQFSLAEVAVLIKFCITFLFVNNEKLSFGQWWLLKRGTGNGKRGTDNEYRERVRVTGEWK